MAACAITTAAGAPPMNWLQSDKAAVMSPDKAGVIFMPTPDLVDSYMTFPQLSVYMNIHGNNSTRH